MARHRTALTVAIAASVILAACGSDEQSSNTGAGGGAEPTLEVQASFYPLAWMAERVGGDQVQVSNLTPPGAEAHDLELTPSDVAALATADVVVYLSGFQPAVDDAMAETEATTFDAADSARMDLTFTGEHDDEHEGEAHSQDEAHDEEPEGATDPHFWLDPTRIADVAAAFADALGEADPDNAATYTDNAEDLASDLEVLDAEMADGLADCERRELVTSHSAFAYLADRYDLEQVGIAGLSPNDEPSPADLADLTEFVADNDVKTIYFETLVSPAVAETLATETGASTAMLDPLEGLTDESNGEDYLAVMRSNLASLQAGQPCP
jgi:zinc transport system substrate-binding protein